MRNAWKYILLVLSWLSTVSVCAAASDSKKKEDAEGHLLTRLWQEYYKADAADLPQKSEKYLDNIIKESSSKGYSWDLYDALVNWQRVVVSRNWKRQAEASERVAKEAGAYNSAVMSYNLARLCLITEKLDSAWYESNVAAGADKLKNGHNARFYSADENLSSLPDYIKDNIRNDYEYILWSLSSSPYWVSRAVIKKAKSDLSEYIGEDEYPVSAYLEFRKIVKENTEKDTRKSALESFADKYHGRAVELYARQELLKDEYGGMNGKSSSADYSAFSKKCAGFEKYRASFSGKEAVIAKDCKEIQALIEELDGHDIRLTVEYDTVLVALKNIGSADVVIKESGGKKKILWKTHLENKARSYYLYDTLKFTLPEINDGKYSIVCTYGKEESSASLLRESISLAKRVNDAGLSIYAADYITGKPVDSADLSLIYRGDTIKTVRNFIFDGFTPVGEELASVIASQKGGVELVCSYTDGKGLLRESPSVWVGNTGRDNYGSLVEENIEATLYLDRAAYNPGDTVRFKSILYKRHRSGKMKVMKGESVRIVFFDNKHNEVESVSLSTNKFGSVAGEFAVPSSDSVRGICTVEVNYGGRGLCSSRCAIDEFVLPTYTIEFDKDDNVHRLPGEKVTVKGRVSSFTGHPLSSANITYSVVYGDFIDTGRLNPDSNGRFELNFVSRDSDWADYTVSVKVVDVTGETAEASRHVNVSSRLYMTGEIKNGLEGDFEYADGYKVRWRENFMTKNAVVDTDVVILKFNVLNGRGMLVSGKEIDYKVYDGQEVIASGKTSSGEYLTINLEGRPSGLYKISATSCYTKADGSKVGIGCCYDVLKLSREDRTLNVPGISNVFMKSDSGKTGVLIGTTDGPVWALAELYDERGNVLLSKKIYLSGKVGEDGSLQFAEFDYKQEYPDAVAFRLFYFKDASQKDFYTEFRRPRKTHDLPLEFTSFTEKTYSGTVAEFTVKTLPGVECLVSVYDKSTESIMGNVWNRPYDGGLTVRRIFVDSACGYSRMLHMRYFQRKYNPSVSENYGLNNLAVAEELMEDAAVMGYGNMKTKAVRAASAMAIENMDVGTSGADAFPNVSVRDDFRKTIAFLPFLKSDDNGVIAFNVVPSGKLSTFTVSLFAHDMDMNNAGLKRDMVVTLPVKVSLSEPLFLYSGDIYRMKVAVSNVADSDVEGILALSVYDNEDYKNSEAIMSQSVSLKVASGGESTGEFEIDVPENVGKLGFKVVFAAGIDGSDISDGLFVSVPVKSAFQAITESHSAVLRPDMDRDSLKRALAGKFTGTLGQSAVYNEIPLLDMLMESLPDKVVPDADDVLSISEAYYMALLSGRIKGVEFAGTDELYDRVVSHQNYDGGFGWFEGFRSSELITAVVLERFALLRDQGLYTADDNCVEKAVEYLDNMRFADAEERWYSGLSLDKYLYVRSMYPEIDFAPETSAKSLKEFVKSVKNCLYPSNNDKLNSLILDKARRITTMMNLCEPSASGLLSAFGAGSNRKLEKAIGSEIASLQEYSVEYPSGGIYYPNAVMPFRGLLESEAYAHSLICDLMDCVGTPESVRIAEGIRLWMMLQKETQHWENSPAYVNVVNSVIRGSDEVKSAKIAVLSKKYIKPFEEIESAGNGYTVEKKYYLVPSDKKMTADNRIELKPGDKLQAGDRIVAEYNIWSKENRSFVKLSVPRYSALQPVNQLSGHVGNWWRPMRGSSSMMSWFMPSGYRTVYSDRTDWYFDVCPEENTAISEEFHIIRSGRFVEPVITIESLYAPHYRANGAFTGSLDVE